MKKSNIFSLLAAPVLLVVLGLILLLWPDSAPALVARILGWGVFLTGIGFGIAGLRSIPGISVGKLIAAIVCLGVGGTLIRHPLMVTSFVTRLLGILLAVQSLMELSDQRDSWKLWDIITAVIGAVLILMPRTASRLVFSVCGLAALLVGVVMLIRRLRRKQLDSGDSDPNIIDAL